MTVKNPPGEHALLKDGLLGWGLSRPEAEVYLYLLQKTAVTGGSKIAEGTKIHRQYVYIALERLIELGLVEAVPFGKQNRYKARSPFEIEKVTRKRSIAASDLVYELNKISAVHHDQDFEVLQGAKQIQRYEMDYVDEGAEGAEEYIIGGRATGFRDVMGDDLEAYLKEKQKKNILVRYLGSEQERKEYEATIGASPNQEFRSIPNMPQGVTHLVVRGDTVLFFSFLTPPLVYVLKSGEVARDYKDFFMMLWNLAK